eukprot:TRINITY_DN1630_c0_g2_i1.p1 TRINITY_DN1630_c0_g2~~TRINITY_DN1630_c0_g2_i1.p1  ORF type:complete len:144 (+),score=28.29 TRINITY_DN1630_c0_g2_i1:96-527(+)
MSALDDKKAHSSLSQQDGEDSVRPCEHNDWDDVRTRNGFKVLRCRVCQGRWKLPSRSVPRCMAFLHDKCDDGSSCGLLHVRKKKCNIGERYERFGESVLKGVARSVQRKAKRHVEKPRKQTLESSGSSDDGPPTLLEEDVTME